jgi:23S rRNA (guanosine2251-2'-O)-methyltransferase
MDEVLLGPNSVLEGLRAGRRSVKRVYVLRQRRGEKIERILQIARARGIPVNWVEKDQLPSSHKSDRHQGIVALVEAQRYYGLEETLGETRQGVIPPLFLVLDRVQDPGNLGSILRTAESAAVDGVVITKDRSAGLGRGVAKSSAGAQEYVRVVKVPNLVDSISKIKGAGMWVVGADQGAERLYWEADLRGPLALVVGGENEGLRRLTRESCDMLVRIPMMGKLSSLNVGVATGIIVFEALRQRLLSKDNERKEEKEAEIN